MKSNKVCHLGSTLLKHLKEECKHIQNLVKKSEELEASGESVKDRKSTVEESLLKKRRWKR